MPQLTEYSNWPVAICTLLLLALAAAPLLNAADAPPGSRSSRVWNIDGLRGFLALAVFFHHAAISHRYWQSGVWREPPSRFFDLLGPFGVGVFFMITAYLFWKKMLHDHGRSQWFKLYVGRVFRIGPVYWLAIATMLTMVAIRCGFQLRESHTRVLGEVLRWSLLGVYWPFDVNHFADTNFLLAGVTWSLHYEWLFYFSLPLTALAVRYRINPVAFTSTLLVAVHLVALTHPHLSFVVELYFAELFLIGMTAASLEHRRWLVRLPQPVSGSLAVACLSAFFLFDHDARTPGAALVLGAFFFLVISGCTLFGLLVTRPALRLGDISYGIYLLQGLVLTLVASLPGAREFALHSPLQHWILILASGMILVGISTIVHATLERPGIALGKRLLAGRATVLPTTQGTPLVRSVSSGQ